MRSTAVRAAFACLLAALACSDLNFEPVNGRLFDPPPIYADWWAQVEDCTSTEAPFERVIWYQAEKIIDRESGTSHGGAWVRPHNIFIRSGSLGNRRVVAHEMVHDLLQTRDHSDPIFDRCSS